MAWNPVVAGGGFAGLYAVRALERRLPRHSAKISIVSGVDRLGFVSVEGEAVGLLIPGLAEHATRDCGCDEKLPLASNGPRRSAR